MVTKLARLVDFRDKIIPIAFFGHTVMVKQPVLALSAHYFLNHLLDSYQTWDSGCH